jgi:hypothetical protein
MPSPYEDLFYFIPYMTLGSRGHLTTTNVTGKGVIHVFPYSPESMVTKKWANEFLFRYSNLDIDRLRSVYNNVIKSITNNEPIVLISEELNEVKVTTSEFTLGKAFSRIPQQVVDKMISDHLNFKIPSVAPVIGPPTISIYGKLIVMRVLSDLGINAYNVGRSCIIVVRLNEVFRNLLVITNISGRKDRGVDRKERYFTLDDDNRDYAGSTIVFLSLDECRAYVISYDMVRRHIEGRSIFIYKSKQSAIDWKNHKVYFPDLGKRIAEYLNQN